MFGTLQRAKTVRRLTAVIRPPPALPAPHPASRSAAEGEAGRACANRDAMKTAVPVMTDGVFDVSLPVRLRTTTRTCRRAAPRRGRVWKAKSAGCDRLHAHQPN